MKLSLLLLIVVSVFFSSCNTHPTSNAVQSGEKIEVEYIAEIKLSELIDSTYAYLPLQTISTPLIGRINKIISTDSAYYILDARFAKAVLKFDKHGKFLHSIGKYGEGNGEYSSLMDILFNNNQIEVYDGSNFSALRFDHHGKFLEEYRIPYWVNEAYQFSDTKKIIYCPTDYSPDGKLEMGVISILSSDLKDIGSTYFPYEEVLDDAPLSGVLNKYGTDFTYVKPVLAEFYTIDQEGKLKARFTADFGKYRWPIDVETMKADQSAAEELFFNGDIMSAIHRLCENKDYLTFHSIMIDKKNAPSPIKDDRDRWLCIFNKTSNKLYAIKKVINDIDGLPFSFPISTEGEDFISVLSSELLTKTDLKKETNSNREASVKNMLDTLGNASNPVLVKFKFRSTLFN
jgi:hypothetical protein